VRSQEISIQSSGSLAGNLKLSIAHDGEAPPASIDLEHPETLGLRLIQMLVEDQLGGKISVSSTDQVRYTIKVTSNSG